MHDSDKERSQVSASDNLSSARAVDECIFEVLSIRVEREVTIEHHDDDGKKTAHILRPARAHF